MPRYIRLRLNNRLARLLGRHTIPNGLAIQRGCSTSQFSLSLMVRDRQHGFYAKPLRGHLQRRFDRVIIIQSKPHSNHLRFGGVDVVKTFRCATLLSPEWRPTNAIASIRHLVSRRDRCFRLRKLATRRWNAQVVSRMGWIPVDLCFLRIVDSLNPFHCSHWLGTLHSLWAVPPRWPIFALFHVHDLTCMRILQTTLFDTSRSHNMVFTE